MDKLCFMSGGPINLGGDRSAEYTIPEIVENALKAFTTSQSVKIDCHSIMMISTGEEEPAWAITVGYDTVEYPGYISTTVKYVKKLIEAGLSPTNELLITVHEYSTYNDSIISETWEYA